MPQVCYEISFNPDPPRLEIVISGKTNSLCVKASKCDVNIVLTPDKKAIRNGAMNQNIFGKFLTAGAQLLSALDGGKIITKAGNSVAEAANGYISEELPKVEYDFPLDDILTHSFHLDGVPVTISAENVELQTFEEYIMLCGGVKLC